MAGNAAGRPVDFQDSLLDSSGRVAKNFRRLAQVLFGFNLFKQIESVVLNPPKMGIFS